MKTFILILCTCFLTVSTQAAKVSFSTNVFRCLRNHEVTVPVYIQSDEDIYGLSADLVYDSTYLALQDQDGNITNGVQPIVEYSSLIPQPRLYCSALEDEVQGRLVWGITQRRPTDGGISFPTNSLLYDLKVNTLTMGTNYMFFGFKNIFDQDGGRITSVWDSAEFYVYSEFIPAPIVDPVPSYLAGDSNTLNWSAVDEADSYLALCAYDSSLTNIAKIQYLTSTNYTFTSLLQTTAYYYAVIATNAMGQQGISVTNTCIQDFNPPTNLTLRINNDALYTDSPILSLRVTASDLTPMTVAAVCNDGSSMSSHNFNYWSTYTCTSTWENGVKEVTAILTDSSGQSNWVTSSIILDTMAPSNAIVSINSGALTTSFNTVTLSLNADDVSPLEVLIANSYDLSDGKWQNFVATTNWTLSGSAVGEYTVYAQFRDPGGETSTIVSDSIYLSDIPGSDTNIFSIAPVDNYTGAPGTLEFTWTAGADVKTPQYLNLIPGGQITGSGGSASATLVAGSYQWYVSAENSWGQESRSEIRTLQIDALPGSDTNIVLLTPANNYVCTEGAVDFNWTAGADVKTPQYLNLIPGGQISAVGSHARLTLGQGNYQWYVSAENSFGQQSQSELRTLTVYNNLIEPIAPQTVRERQILFAKLVVNSAATIRFLNANNVGTHYLNTNTYTFSLIPDFGKAGSDYNIPFIATLGSLVNTQTLVVTVMPPTKKIKDSMLYRFEDTDEDLLDIKYSGIKKNNSTLLFDGQRLIISSAYDKGKLIFKVMPNKKSASSDGLFMFDELTIDGKSAVLMLDATVSNLFANGHEIGTLKINAPNMFNLNADYIRVLSVSKGAIVGNVTVNRGISKIIANDIIGARIVVNSGDNMSIKVKNDIANSIIAINGAANTLAVKQISTSGKGSIANSTIIIGLPVGADYTNTLSRAGFKMIKSKDVSNTDIAGSDYNSGKKMASPKLKIKNRSNTTFYHTKNGAIIEE